VLARDLAILYQNRKSSLYDAKQAILWYRQVAEGNSGSQDRARIALAHFCRNGEGTPHDVVQAKAWLQKVIESAPVTSRFYKEAKALLQDWDKDSL